MAFSPASSSRFEFTTISDPRRNLGDQSQARTQFLTDIIISPEEYKEKEK